MKPFSRSAARMRASFSLPVFWIWTLAAAASLLCGLTLFIHCVHSKSMKSAYLSIDGARQARADVSSGFISLMACEGFKPAKRGREEGLALLRKGLDAAEESLASGEASVDKSGPDLTLAMADFKLCLERWLDDGEGSTTTESLLASSFHRLDASFAALHKERRFAMVARAKANRREFASVVVASALALVVICFALRKIWGAQLASERRSKDGEARLRNVLDTSGDALFKWRLDAGSFDFVSLAVEELSGFSLKRVERMSLEELASGAHSDDLMRIRASLSALVDGVPFKAPLPFRMVRADCSVRWVELSAKLVRGDDNSPCCVVGSLRDIDERMKTQARLQADEERFRLLVETLPQQLFVKDASLRYTFCNELFAKHVGRPVSEIIGKTSADIIPAADAQRCFLQDRDAIENRRIVDSEERSCLCPGMWVQSWRIPLFDASGASSGVMGLFWDITQRKNTELALARERRFTRAVFDSVPGILFLYDENLKLSRWNNKHVELTGYSPSELAGMNVFSWFKNRPNEISAVEAAIASLRLSGHVDTELSIEIKSGKLLPLSVSAERLELDGKVYFAGVGIEISEQLKNRERLAKANAELERNVESRTRELAQAKERAESADRLKSAFLSEVATELKTPLASISGLSAAALQERGEREENRARLEMIRSSAGQLLTLIKGVLEVSKLDAGQVAPVRAPFDVSRALSELVEPFALAASQKGLSIRVLSDFSNGLIVSDEALVKRMVSLLLDNAVKFSSKGEIFVRAMNDGDSILLRVSDSGPGIAEADMPLLFQPFRRLGGLADGKPSGFGLGLAICKGLAKALGGELAVRSEWGKGSSFTVKLPLKSSSFKA